MSENLFVAFVERYGPHAGPTGPEKMVREVFHAEPDKWQVKVLRAIGSCEPRVAVRSCHGVGKTTVAAWAVVHRLIFCFPQKTVATAPTASQLEDALYPEVLKWFRKLPESIQALYDVTTTSIELKAKPEECFFRVKTSRAEKPEAFQGVHCDPGYVLLIGDEASGIPEQVYEAGVGSMSGHNCTTLLISNPVRTSGYYFNVFHQWRDQWLTIHVSYRESKRVSEDFVNMIARQYGENSNVFRVRCLGEFPRSDDDTIIPFELVAGARERDIAVANHLPRVWGVDVARFGNDKSSLIVRNERCVPEVPILWNQLSTMELAGRIKAKWDETRDIHLPKVILIDNIGLGSGVEDRLFELGLPVRGINVAETASSSEKFLNSRAELWWLAREWLGKKDVLLPKADKTLDPRQDPAEILARELVIPKYKYTSSGKLQVESKEDMKKRGFDSPNVADAFVITFAEDLSRMIHGSAGSSSWGEPISRNLPVV